MDFAGLSSSAWCWARRASWREHRRHPYLSSQEPPEQSHLLIHSTDPLLTWLDPAADEIKHYADPINIGLVKDVQEFFHLIHVLTTRPRCPVRIGHRQMVDLI